MPGIQIQPGNQNETDNFIPTNKGGPRYSIPSPVRPGQRPEGLDRRIRNLEALGNGVFIGNTLASYMALPGLVGFWSMNNVQRSTGNVYDSSGQSRPLTYNGNPAYTYYNGLVAYVDMDGTGDFLSRGDETDLDITGIESIFTTGAAGLTMGGWFWFDTIGATERGLISKYTSTGNQRSYLLYKTTADTINGTVSTDGSATTSVTGATVEASIWYFLALRFTPSTSLDIFVNSTKSSNTTSIPASIFNSTAGLNIGGFNAGAALLDGRASLCFLCANALGDDLISSLFETSRVLFGI